MIAWYAASVRATSSADSRSSMLISSGRMVTGWPPRPTTAISPLLRVRADGFWNTNATPRPASTFGTALAFPPPSE